MSNPTMLLILSLIAFSGAAAQAGDLVAVTSSNVCFVQNDKVNCQEYTPEGWGFGARIPSGLKNITEISGGIDHACVIADGTIRCWGTLFPHPYGSAPNEISDFKNPRNLLTINRNICANTDDGFKCYDIGTPLRGLNPDNLKNSYIYSINNGSGCGLTQGKVSCVFSEMGSSVTTDHPELPPVRFLSHGSEVTWGDSIYAATEAGIYRFGFRNGVAEKFETGLTNVQEIVSGGSFSCARGDEGVNCWPEGLAPHFVPAIPKNIKNISKIVASDKFICLVASGKASCYNKNGLIQLK